jgi:serine/threonine protein kinase
LARGVAAVHCADFVHKNIRPENILVLSEDVSPLPVSFLFGFERFRPAAAGTNLTGDNLWERNLCRHPTRQGIKLNHVYVMQHDIYSLGICLLEVGLWTSFVLPSGKDARPGHMLDVMKQITMNKISQAAWEIKRLFIEMARDSLPSIMGIVYIDVVVSCLTCLDAKTTNLFGDEKDLYDQDGILVGVSFIEKFS